MNINDSFPSNYVKAADLRGKECPAIISRVVVEKLGDDDKPVVYFEGKEKGVVLNKTNAMNIATMHGPETDNWPGKHVILYPAWVDFQGRSVEAVRIRPDVAPTNGAMPPAPSVQAETPPPNPGADQAGSLDDEIPF